MGEHEINYTGKVFIQIKAKFSNFYTTNPIQISSYLSLVKTCNATTRAAQHEGNDNERSLYKDITAAMMVHTPSTVPHQDMELLLSSPSFNY